MLFNEWCSLSLSVCLLFFHVSVLIEGLIGKTEEYYLSCNATQLGKEERGILVNYIFNHLPRQCRLIMSNSVSVKTALYPVLFRELCSNQALLFGDENSPA